MPEDLKARESDTFENNEREGYAPVTYHRDEAQGLRRKRTEARGETAIGSLVARDLGYLSRDEQFQIGGQRFASARAGGIGLSGRPHLVAREVARAMKSQTEWIRVGKGKSLGWEQSQLRII